MQVRMNTIYCGPKGFCDIGKTIELPDAEARQIIDGGYGVAVECALPAALTSGDSGDDEPAADKKTGKRGR